jgi:CHAT domain-containing protein
MNMRNIAYTILFLWSISTGVAQNTLNLNKTKHKFWRAVATKNDRDIISHGILLINQIESDKFVLDTLHVQIRILIALSYSNQADYLNALDWNHNTKNLIRQNWDSEYNYFYVTVLRDIASDYSIVGDYSKALEFNLQALKIVECTQGIDHHDYAIFLRLIASNYSDMGDYLKALEIGLQSLERVENTIGKRHSEFALSLNNIAHNLNLTGDYSKALEYNLQALKINKKTLGKKQSNYVTSLNNIAVTYSNLGNYSKALEYNLEALKIRKKKLGKEHPDYALSLNNIAVIYSDLGDYSKALEYNLEAREIRRNTIGNDHPDYAQSLNNIAVNYGHMGYYLKALEYNFEALKIRENTIGNDHPDYAQSLNNIAVNYSHMGDYLKSLEYNLEALKIRENSIGSNHPKYAISLHNIAKNYSDFGDDPKALEINLKALEIRKNILGKVHPDYANSLQNIASNYNGIGDYSTALKYNLEALEIRGNILGREHPYYAHSLNNIASNFLDLEDYTQALQYNLEALKIYENILGKEHPDYAVSLNNLAFNYSTMEDYSRALEYYLQALKVYETSIGTWHPNYLTCLYNIAANYSSISDYSSCSRYLNESYTIQEQSFTKNKFGLDKRMQENYKINIVQSIEFISGFQVINSDILQFVNKSWINLNGLLSADTKNLENQILETGDTSLVKTMESLKLSKMQLAKYNELTLKEKEQRGINQQVLEDEITAMERELSKKSQAFANFNRYFYASDVTKELDVNEFFVDIARIPYYSFYSNKWTDSIKYLVFITDSKDTLVDYLFIDNGLELEKELISDYKLESSDKNAATDLKNEIFYNSFWKPIAEKIGDAKTVYVSLGGVYNSINLNTLYNPETGKYLLEEKDIRIVNSARDFVLSKEREKKQYTSTTSAFYGFPDFNGNATKTVDTTDFLSSTRDLDKMWIDSLTRGGMKASPLPATKVEVEQIAGTFQKNGWSVKKYTGENASETNIKQEVSPRVLHVATHGYFFEDIPIDKSNDRFLGMDRQRVVQDPMLRSGLLFTGANKTLQGEQVKGENGLLSAAEASLLDLRETELVVLSACETGKGEVKNSEGVYGLRKAFSDAGAQNIIMSLWKVDDKVTQEFMSRFYEIWLNEKTTIREAFNRTQLEIKAKYPQPYYWGAFILVGE